MSFETAKQIVDNLLANDDYYNTHKVEAIVLEFIGGEPFMEIELMQ